MAAHKWAAEIHAFAEGQQVQSSRINVENWLDDNNPQFNAQKLRFRIKPAEPERVYVKTLMTDNELLDAIVVSDQSVKGRCRIIANTALAHAQDAGQIVTREEFDRAVGDKEKRDWDLALSVARRVSLNRGRYSSDDLKESMAEVK